MSTVMLHHYPLSPYSEKIRLALGLMQLPGIRLEIPGMDAASQAHPNDRRISTDADPSKSMQDFYCVTSLWLASSTSSAALHPKGQEGI